jgi:glutaredoxin-like YruB-family protein
MPNQKKVIIYTAVWCPWCKRTKQFFDEHGVKYEERDIEKDPKNAEEVVEKSGQMGIPVTDIDGEIVVGFDKERLSELLGIRE